MSRRQRISRSSSIVSTILLSILIVTTHVGVEASDDGLRIRPTFPSHHQSNNNNTKVNNSSSSNNQHHRNNGLFDKNNDEGWMPTIDDDDNNEDERYIMCPSNNQGKQDIQENANQVHFENLRSVQCMSVSMSSARAEALMKNPHITSIEQDVKRYLVSIRPSYYGSGGDGVLRHIRGGRGVEPLRQRTASPVEESITPLRHRDRRLQQTTPYGIGQVQADKLSVGDESVMICIIDSGYDVTHEDLPSMSNKVNGYNGGNLPWNQDGLGHGTHVAGTISALNNGVGVVGVIPDIDQQTNHISIYVVRVFGDEGGWTYSSNLIDALERCEAAGANVVSMSLGCSGYKNCSSKTEERAFDQAFRNNGILSVAAAGNAGTSACSYPACYDSVISVAASDRSMNVAPFSQYNFQTELTAPGVAVQSTVPMNTVDVVTTKVNGTPMPSLKMEYSPDTDTVVEGPLVDCGKGDSMCLNANEKICLIQRGVISFYDKVLNCEKGGGIGTIIYNNEEGMLRGTLGEGSQTVIPSVGITLADGMNLLENINTVTASIEIVPKSDHYNYYDGTSMATPHVSGVIALILSHVKNLCDIQRIRTALQQTAFLPTDNNDGSITRNDSYGYGIVQAYDALMYLKDVDKCASSMSLPLSELCQSKEYWDDLTSTCHPCDSSVCSKCEGLATFCTSCVASGFIADMMGKCVCRSGTYLDDESNTCMNCHASCVECNGPSSNECTKCPSNTYLSDASTCIPCHSSCVECNGSLESQCTSCPPGSNLQEENISGVGTCIIPTFTFEHKHGRRQGTSYIQIVSTSTTSQTASLDPGCLQIEGTVPVEGKEGISVGTTYWFGRARGTRLTTVCFDGCQTKQICQTKTLTW